MQRFRAALVYERTNERYVRFAKESFKLYECYRYTFSLWSVIVHSLHFLHYHMTLPMNKIIAARMNGASQWQCKIIVFVTVNRFTLRPQMEWFYFSFYFSVCCAPLHLCVCVYVLTYCNTITDDSTSAFVIMIEKKWSHIFSFFFWFTVIFLFSCFVCLLLLLLLVFFSFLSRQVILWN